MVNMLDSLNSLFKLPAEDIYVPPQHQPINPDEEDDVVPDQHAAFGIQRATQKAREPVWRDYGLAGLMAGGPPARTEGQSQARPGARQPTLLLR
ncbi:hypothetical protein LTR62_000179 [Meristemomyces frigidus]|uniref:Anaphase-promoting complex subunit 13 n=1 Tax=Meristemomyces frigidus TaxID=1508187 RepID=A0AAN7TR41_9PEZI|nr:hypothetical protein LTR62_000179 [Meristemomyces frigidus]